jgi:hypothetical protein
VYRALAVARWLPERTDLTRVLGRRGVGGFSLGWSHLVSLAEIEDDSIREDLLAAVLRKGLSVRELASEIRRLLHGSGPGRRPRPRFESVGGALLNVTSMASKLLERLDADFPNTVAAPLEAIDAADATEELVGQLAASRERLEALAERAGQRAREMLEVEQRFRQGRGGGGAPPPDGGAGKEHARPGGAARQRRPVEA